MLRHVLSALFLSLSGCSAIPGLQAGLETAGAAVDTFALVRAEQIKAKGAAASEAAARGDTFTAMRELNAALAAMAASTWDELAAVKAENAALRAQCHAPPVTSRAPLPQYPLTNEPMPPLPPPVAPPKPTKDADPQAAP